jgi:hypothetical protein
MDIQQAEEDSSGDKEKYGGGDKKAYGGTCLGGDFLPSQPQFWIYFSISLPLLLMALVFAFASQRVIDAVVLWKER